MVTKEPDQTGNIGGGWHTDHSYDPEPAMGSILIARELPPEGGDTWFLDMYKAYEGLPRELKSRIKDLSAVHSAKHIFGSKDQLEMLKQTGREEMVVGWYHSHPGFGCWLSGVDVNTQQSFEALNQRAVAVVVDPIQSVKGKVVIDCFRSINPQMIMLGQEPRQTTSNLGHLNKPSIQALIHGLNRHYYSIALSYRKNELEQQMLQNHLYHLL